jgi:hypothetical protein
METTNKYDTTIEEMAISPETTNSNHSIQLELGDIIEVIAPSNNDLHEMTGFITYIDDRKVTLVNTATGKTHILNIMDDGTLSDESITELHLLSRSDVKGYARQNNLLTKTWIDIHFGGEIPAIITGEITNLEEDMIEITTFPEIKTIYLNFGYKGLPENIPIKRIDIRSKPSALKNVRSLALVRQELEEGEEFDPVNYQDNEAATVDFTETGESIITVPEDGKMDDNVRESLHNLYIDANSIIFGESLDVLERVVEVPESQRRYSIEEQVNDMVDELLSTIPNSQRTTRVMNNIHLLIERFKELRTNFSKFDSNQNVYDIKQNGFYYKPLIDKIQNIDTQLKWLIPVVTNKKHICSSDDVVETDDVILYKDDNDLVRLEQLQDSYFHNKNTDQTLTYKTLNIDTSTILMPFSKPSNTPQFLETKRVLTNIDAIVDNLGEFNSTVFGDKNNPLATKQFLIQRYNLGLSNIERLDLNAGKTVYLRKPMTSNDSMTIKSLIMMPEPVVRFSTVNLPNTNILQKSTLHENYASIFRLLKKNSEIIPHVINDLSKELDYEKMENETKMEFLSGIQEFILGNNLSRESYDNDKFRQFLEIIVPKTHFFIKSVRKYVKNKISFLGFVEQLEPFAVYPESINLKQYNQIKFLVRERIKEIKDSIAEKSKKYNYIKNATYGTTPFSNNRILKLISDNSEFYEPFFKSYHLLSDRKGATRLTSQEILLHMNDSDNSKLYTNLVTSILISLITPENINNAINNPNIDEMTDNERIKAYDCSKRFLTKKYTSIKDLQRDNNNDEVYYDAEFDDTPYHILNKYKEQEKKMLPELFHEFLIETLIHKHDASPDIAKQMAKTIISGKKMVSDGEYAILEIKPTLQDGRDINSLSSAEKESIDIEENIRKKISYYRRVKDNWVKDDSIEDESFIDTNTLFCNISRECYKNSKNGVCESTDETVQRFKKITREKLLNEFDKRYEISIEELEKKLEDNIAYHLKMLNKSRILKDIQLYKANNLAYTIGSLINSSDVIMSPHLPLRDLILGQDNFTKKQQDIVTFVRKYCRYPLVSELNEHHAWLYCKDTNTKLFPISLSELADTFTNGSDYNEKLEELCHVNGVLSDDGDSIVDKYSGFVLRKIDFSSEEGFDESGFRVTSRDLLEKDLGSVVLESLGKKKHRVFETALSETIYNVFSTIASSIDINVDGIEDYVMRTSSEIIEKNIMKEDTYNRKSKKMEKEKGKSLGPYEKYYNETIIIIIASVFIVAIQTAIPSFKPKKTFPGCVRSFSGFPMDGAEDITGIKYVACVLHKITSQISPWNAIKQYKPDNLTNRIKSMIDLHILKRGDIAEMYVKKREYMLLNPDTIIPSEHNIEKWKHFLPPVVKFSIVKSLRNVSTEFKKDLIELLRYGKTEQFKSIYVLQSRITQFGYGLIEYINHIVRNKDQLLKTSSQLPFLENACCNEDNITNPIVYFNKEDENINICIKTVEHLSAIVNDIRQLTKAPSFYHLPFTGMQYPIITSGDLEELVYSTIIHYCNFDRNLPVPDIYKSVCSERPIDYNPSWDITNKIEFLKRNGKKYTESDLRKLMKLVFNKNQIQIDIPEKFNQVTVMKEIIHNLELTHSTIIEAPLRKHMLKVLNKYNPKVMTSEKSDELKVLDRYLTTTNTRLYKEISTFLDKYGNLSEREFNKIDTFLLDITKWSIDKNMTDTNSYSDKALYTIIQFIKNASFSICKVYPSALLRDSPFYYKVPTHWGVSDHHANDIMKFIEKYYEKLQRFKSDKIITRLLLEIGKRLSTINMFMENIPIQTEIVKEVDGSRQTFHNVFDKSTVYKLYTYCFYSIIYEYIVLANDSNLLMADIETTKTQRRQEIRNNKDEAEQLYTEQSDINENTAEIQDSLEEIQIVTGNLLELKERVASLLISFIQVEQDNKKSVDMTYEKIMKQVNRSKDKEKQGIISYLGNMSIEERKIEDMFKKHKLERWNIGQQKGIFQYDPSTYDRERTELITQLYTEQTDLPSETNLESLDIYDIERGELYEPGDNYNRDTYDFHDLNEDYMDGNFYPEDQEEDDFPED